MGRRLIGADAPGLDDPIAQAEAHRLARPAIGPRPRDQRVEVDGVGERSGEGRRDRELRRANAPDHADEALQATLFERQKLYPFWFTLAPPR